MKILTPLNDLDHLDTLIDAGAGEFYIGFHDPAWETAFGQYADINRMSGFGQAANQYNFKEILHIAEIASQANVGIYITLNANGYSSSQIEFMCENYLPALSKAGISGVIVSDEIIAQVVRSFGIEPVASTMCGIYNADIATAYEKVGVRRMILPRDLSLQEIDDITSLFPCVEFEVFFMRNGCVFSDSHCLGMHRKEYGGICSTLKRGKKEFFQANSSFQKRHDLYLNDYLYNNFYHSNACGMCALYRMRKMNVSSLKIVGRADSPYKICRDVELTRHNLHVAECAGSEDEYLRKMRWPENSVKTCMLGFSCYYPEIRFP